MRAIRCLLNMYTINLVLNLAMRRGLLLGILIFSQECTRAHGQGSPPAKLPPAKDWVQEHHDTGLHFRKVGQLVGSLQFGHLRFTIDLKHVGRQLL